jgi:Tfp pilus assembly protein PilF
MMRTLRRAAFLASFCLLFAGLSFGQMATFMGKVIGPDGKGLKDAVIKIERKDIKGNWQTKSNKKGEWIYSGMQAGGQYLILCEVNGQVMDQISGVRAQMGDPMEFTFDLKKIADKQAAMQKAAETGQVTAEVARDMSPEQKAALEKQMKERSAAMAKNKALNDTFNAGMTALQAKDYQTASDSFSKAAELDPKQYAVWANMAASYEGLAGTKTPGAEKDAALARATEAYTKALEIKPDDAGLHNNFALCLVKQKKIEEAKAELEKAAALDPTQAGKYYFNLGAVMVNTGQNDAATDSFKKAVSLDPNHADSWYYIGNTLSGKLQVQGDKVIAPEGMKEALEKYLALAPTGQYADAAKGLLSTLSTNIQTNYTNPDAPKAGSKKKK